MQSLKKYYLQTITDTAEVNLFKEDNTVIHFENPTVHIAPKEKFVVLLG